MRAGQGRRLRQATVVGATSAALLLASCGGGESEEPEAEVPTPSVTDDATTSPEDSPGEGEETTTPPQDDQSTTSAPGEEESGPDDEEPADDEDTEGEDPQDEADDPEAGVVWEDNTQVSHIFFHSLVIDPERAFSDAESGAGYLDYMITQDEMAALLPELYENDYVLISPHDLAEFDDDGQVEAKELRLPEGKKPLVISIDDVSYYEYMEGDGFADDLVIGDDGRVLNTYTDAEGHTEVGSYDVMSMVDDFVAEHPDFSHENARGVIALTGYNGVLGYRTSPSEYPDNEDIEEDIATATEVADALKAEGWEFASHTWGHINAGESSMDRIRSDNELWKEEVEPIVGETDLLIFPFGSDLSDVAPYEGEKFEYYKDEGFDFYFNVDGSTPAWGQWGEDYVRQARFNIDGLSLKAALDGREAMHQIFDPEAILDDARPDSISGS